MGSGNKRHDGTPVAVTIRPKLLPLFSRVGGIVLAEARLRVSDVDRTVNG